MRLQPYFERAPKRLRLAAPSRIFPAPLLPQASALASAGYPGLYAGARGFGHRVFDSLPATGLPKQQSSEVRTNACAVQGRLRRSAAHCWLPALRLVVLHPVLTLA